VAANRNFLLGYGFFFLVGLIFLLVKGKTGSFLFLNPFHGSPLNLFFINFTYLGDGLFAVGVIILLMSSLYKNLSYARATDPSGFKESVFLK